MSNNYEAATVNPYFPPKVIKKFAAELDELNVQYEDDGYVYVEDGCHDWDAFIAILQKMLKAARMKYCYVQGASWADKMRHDEFGGFAQFITPDDCIFINTGSWVVRREAEFKARQKNKRFIPVHEAMQIVFDLANENAINPEDDPDLRKEARRQQDALNTVHDFMVTHFAEEDQS